MSARSAPCGLPRRGHLGADRRPQRQEQRQRGERIEILGPPRLVEIAIEHDIGRWPQPALDQVHQQEGEIVEHVAGGDLGIEFDGVEQHRRAVEQDDIAEMQIAVAAPHAGRRARARRAAPARARRRRASHRVNALTAAGGKSSGAARSSASFWAMISASVIDKSGIGDDRRRRVRSRHRPAERVGERAIDPAAPRPDGRASASRRSGRISTAHSTGSPAPPMASAPSFSRVIATARR